jgi:hypothetical protein
MKLRNESISEGGAEKKITRRKEKGKEGNWMVFEPRATQCGSGRPVQSPAQPNSLHTQYHNYSP